MLSIPAVFMRLLALHVLTSAAAFQPQPAATTLRPLSLSGVTAPRGGSFGVVPSPRLAPTTSLSSETSSSSSKGIVPGDSLDVDALGKYALAAGVQMGCFASLFTGLDAALAAAGIDSTDVPFPAVALLFYAFSLKSRLFNPLNNQRPDRAKAIKGEEGSNGFRDRVMPSWTPPGVVFPIMWLLIIGPIRAYSAATVFEHTGTFACPALLAFVFHLTIGDVWNTINNTEKRYGASVVGVSAVVASAAFAASNYYEVDPFAGKLLGGTLLWLVTAGALITDTWRLNPRSDGGRVPLYPVVGEAQTEFSWLSKNSE